MTTRLTDDVLARVHCDMIAGADLAPTENQLIAAVLNGMDDATVDGYDSDAAAAGLFAFAAAVRSTQFGVRETANPAEIVRELTTYIATMAAFTGQALHAQTHAVAEAPEPERDRGPALPTEQPRPWRNLPQGSTAVIEFDKVPWPPDRRKTLPTVIVGQAPEPYMLEAVRQYRAARGLPALIAVPVTAKQVNEAVTWWNHRAAMLAMEEPR